MHVIKERDFSASIADLAGRIPKCSVSDVTDTLAIARLVMEGLPTMTTDMLTADAIWRDMFAFTGAYRTLHGSQSIISAWNKLCPSGTVYDVALSPQSVRVARCGAESAWIEAMFLFEKQSTPLMSCSGFVSVVVDEKGGWRIWLLRTMLENVHGFGDVDALTPFYSNGVNSNGSHDDYFNKALSLPQGTSMPDLGHSQIPSSEILSRYQDLETECVVIGAGQSGLSVAGRLQALGVSYMVLDRNAKAGDNWRNRYNKAKFHTPRNYAHLPFDRTFPNSYPEYLGKDDIGDGYEAWVRKYNINFWGSIEVKQIMWDAGKSRWTLDLGSSLDKSTIKVTTQHIVFAIGVTGQIPSLPHYPDRDKFKGDCVHSIDFKSADAWVGKKGVVIGTANTAFDIVEDMLDSGLSSVTMVQRSPTFVADQKWWFNLLSGLYNDNFPIDLADRLSMTSPLFIRDRTLMAGLAAQSASNPDRYDMLEKTDFKLKKNVTTTDFLYRDGGRYYMDTGTTTRIIEGRVQVKSNALPQAFTETGIVFTDGSELAADLVVFATGFVMGMHKGIVEMLGPEITDSLPDIGGFSADGEVRGTWSRPKNAKHPGLWIAGGTLPEARFQSRFLALQIKAELEGMPFTPV